MSGFRTGLGLYFAVLVLSLGSFCRAQTFLLNSGGTGGAASSMPTVSNFEAVYQQSSASIPTLTTSDPAATGATPVGQEAFIGTLPSGSSGLGFYYNSPGNNNYYGTVVYDTHGTTGSAANNPLGLGTASATPNTFSVMSGQTITYSADFGGSGNNHGTHFVTLFNPAATDAGSSNASNGTSGGYLGVSLKEAYGGGGVSASSFATLNNFGAAFSGGLPAISGTTTATYTAPAYTRLVLTLTNNGNGTDTVGGTVYSLTYASNYGIGGVPTLVATLAPTTFTLGTSSGNYDLNNNALGIELGELAPANANVDYYAGNISLSVPEPASCGVLFFGVMGLIRGRRSDVRSACI